MTGSALVILAPSATGMGGIQRLTREVIAMAGDVHRGEVIVLTLEGPSGRDLGQLDGPARLKTKATYAARVVGAVARRPQAVVCLHVGLSPLARVLARRSRARYAVAAYGLEVWGDLRRSERWGLVDADEIWSISTFTTEQLVAQGVPDSRIRPWLLGLPPGATVTPTDRADRRESAQVLAVARLTNQDAYKGVDTLLAAWPAVLRKVPYAQLRVVGDGDMRPGLERLAEMLQVTDSVEFLGSVDDETLKAEYALADVFALPGRTRLESPAQGEGFGIVFLEAAAAGLPTLAGRSGGTPEAVLDQETGLLVDPTAPQVIAASLVRLLLDPVLSHNLGSRGAEWVHAERSTEHARAHLRGLITDLLRSA